MFAIQYGIVDSLNEYEIEVKFCVIVIVDVDQQSFSLFIMASSCLYWILSVLHLDFASLSSSTFYFVLSLLSVHLARCQITCRFLYSLHQIPSFHPECYFLELIGSRFGLLGMFESNFSLIQTI